jgi:hypothetical protein
MKAVAISLGALALLAGCGDRGSDAIEHNLVESNVRRILGEHGDVSELNMTRQADGNYAGLASVREADGFTARLNCTATRQGEGFMSSCRRIIDDALLEQLKASMRRTFTSRGVTVVDFELTRLDDDRIGGHVDLRAPDGREARLPCTGGRAASAADPISVRCLPPADGSAPAPPPPAEEGAPAAE